MGDEIRCGEGRRENARWDRSRWVVYSGGGVKSLRRLPYESNWSIVNLSDSALKLRDILKILVKGVDKD